ncbi:MAG: alpha/beta fold hydrolase [Chloroflexi bacterium]|nr:alpha/beta fold hydrolase [Chloroflexota bacterium]
MPTLRLQDGLSLFYCVDDFTDPWIKPQTVLLHHGNCKNHLFWYAWMPILARHYRVVRLDARGYGDSEAPPPGFPWSLSVFASDILSLLDHLGLEKAHFVGETIGGTIGMNFAAEHPERLRSLTICTSPFKFTKPYYADSARMVEEKGVEAWVRHTMGHRLEKESDPKHHEWYVKQMARTKPWVVSETHYYLAGKDLSDRLRQVHVPTLILAPEEEDQERQLASEEMRHLIPGSRLVRIKGTSGFVQHSMPEACARVVLDFLREVDRQPT